MRRRKIQYASLHDHLNERALILQQEYAFIIVLAEGSETHDSFAQAKPKALAGIERLTKQLLVMSPLTSTGLVE
jgi:hypothetical protein